MGEEGEKVERETGAEGCGRGGGPAMDTPDRSRIATPISKFEDSPVFNYINSLSPIKTVKSLRISQTFNSLSFASLPSVFTSPHVNSVKESKFLRRHPSLDLSKPELSSKNGKKVGTSEGATDPTHNSDEEQENFDPAIFIGEASAEQTYECTKLAVEVSQNLNYDCGSPDCSTIHCHGSGNKCVPDFAGTSTSVVQFVQEVSETCYVGSREHAEGTRKTEQNADGPGCDWESMISDTTDLLIFNSPNEPDAFKGSFQKSLDAKARTYTSFTSEMAHDQSKDLPKVQVVGSMEIEQHETGNPSSLVGENNTKENEATGHILASTSVNKNVTGEPSEQIDNEPVSNLHRGMRRRCLVFEMVGARRKHVDNSSSSASSIASQSNVNIECNDKQLVPIKPGNDSSRCILPGIGLHLNALARTSKECSIVCHEPLGSGRQLMDDPSSSASFRSLSTGQEPPHNSLVVTPSERNRGPTENGVQVAEDASQAPGYIASEEFNQSSPKKKRRRAENGGESEGCKRCNCKKSKCLKLYCECFAAGVYCVEPCSCQDCFNKPIHEDTVLATRKQIESRNPLAFAPKVIRSSDSLPEMGDENSKTPASARHKRGCNCKKSGCLKKYCECYQGGVGCSINCRCEGCKNAFGKKDGSTSTGADADLEEEETDTSERSVMDKTLQKNLVPISEQNTDPTATPLRCARASVQLPFSSKSKPPRSSFLSIGSSSGFFSSQRFGKPNLLQPQPQFEKQIETVQEDEMPDILRGNCSPISGIKSASPNSKRVSPPHGDFLSPARRSSRKLILQSIPSFPSLTPKH